MGGNTQKDSISVPKISCGKGFIDKDSISVHKIICGKGVIDNVTRHCLY